VHQPLTPLASLRRPGLLLLAASLLAQAGCATYSDRLVAARGAMTAGDYSGGVQELDKLLKVDEPGALPDDWGGDQALLVLERATMHQALEDYELSERDFQAADKELDLLDIAGDAVGTIGKYIYSDSAPSYRSPPTEKLALNGFNMLNYLAQRDLSGARVEAKRFTVMRNYLVEHSPEDVHGAFGSYVAGFVFDQLGEYGSAMRYYDEALQHARFAGLRDTLGRLSSRTSYRGKHVGEFLEQTAASPGGNPKGWGQLLVVVSIGRVSHKVPQRIPIGAAVGLAGVYITGDPEILEYSAMKVLVYPELVDSPSVYQKARLRIDERTADMDLASDLDAEIRREYEALKPKIIGAAISRMIVRAAVAEGARQAGQEVGGAGEVVGLVAALLAEGAMVAADKPDTRSWESMPRWVYVYQQSIAPGEHVVTVDLQGAEPTSQQFSVDVPADGFAAVILTAPR
jgi:tetratricopeptide (TPR) repeat protein